MFVVLIITRFAKNDDNKGERGCKAQDENGMSPVARCVKKNRFGDSKTYSLRKKNGEQKTNRRENVNDSSKVESRTVEQ